LKNTIFSCGIVLLLINVVFGLSYTLKLGTGYTKYNPDQFNNSYLKLEKQFQSLGLKNFTLSSMSGGYTSIFEINLHFSKMLELTLKGEFWDNTQEQIEHNINVGGWALSEFHSIQTFIFFPVSLILSKGFYFHNFNFYIVGGSGILLGSSQFDLKSKTGFSTDINELNIYVKPDISFQYLIETKVSYPITESIRFDIDIGYRLMRINNFRIIDIVDNSKINYENILGWNIKKESVFSQKTKFGVESIGFYKKDPSYSLKPISGDFSGLFIDLLVSYKLPL